MAQFFLMAVWTSSSLHKVRRPSVKISSEWSTRRGDLKYTISKIFTALPIFHTSVKIMQTGPGGHTKPLWAYWSDPTLLVWDFKLCKFQLITRHHLIQHTSVQKFQVAGVLIFWDTVFYIFKRQEGVAIELQRRRIFSKPNHQSDKVRMLSTDTLRWGAFYSCKSSILPSLWK